MSKLSDSQHLKNIVVIAKIDDWDEEVMPHIYDYLEYYGLIPPINEYDKVSEKDIKRIEERIGRPLQP